MHAEAESRFTHNISQCLAETPVQPPADGQKLVKESVQRSDVPVESSTLVNGGKDINRDTDTLTT